jgi:peptidoglycan/LPS O-acetylase OafA/YrhL
MSKINIWSWHGLSWAGLRERDRSNDVRTSQWCFLWVLTLLAASAVVNLDYVPRPAGTALVLLTLFPAWKFVGAFKQLLTEADEMLRRVQFEALAVGFGAGLVCGLTFAMVTPPGPWWFLGTLLPMVIGYVTRIVMAAHVVEEDEQS